MTLGPKPSNNPLGLPPNIKDQVDAAARDSAMSLIMHTLTSPDSRGLTITPNAVVLSCSCPRDLLVAGAIHRLEARSLQLCPHLSPNPEPVMLALWSKPETLQCRSCFADLPVLEGDEDFRCDGCGAIDPEQMVYQIASGPITFLFALCMRCQQASCG